jgi:glutathione S-transferase
MTIKLYSWPMSSGTRIAWALEELALPYEYVPLDAKKQDHRSPEMLAINPHGKVPALDDDGLKLFESGAILLYLGSRYGAAQGLWPGPKGQQALADAVCWTVWG